MYVHMSEVVNRAIWITTANMDRGYCRIWSTSSLRMSTSMIGTCRSGPSSNLPFITFSTHCPGLWASILGDYIQCSKIKFKFCLMLWWNVRFKKYFGCLKFQQLKFVLVCVSSFHFFHCYYWCIRFNYQIKIFIKSNYKTLYTKSPPPRIQFERPLCRRTRR